MADLKKLGDHLRSGRDQAGLTLREVEEKVEISNAYLSQLEGGKVKQPSPNVLARLCDHYGISYSAAMELAGYPLPQEAQFSSPERRFHSRLGRTSVDEQEALLEYLRFLRTRKR